MRISFPFSLHTWWENQYSYYLVSGSHNTGTQYICSPVPQYTVRQIGSCLHFSASSTIMFWEDREATVKFGGTGGTDPDLTAASRMAYCYVLHKASEKAAEVVGVSVEKLMRLGTKIGRICLILHPVPATRMGNTFPAFAASKLFTSLPTGHPMLVSSVLGHVSGYM